MNPREDRRLVATAFLFLLGGLWNVVGTVVVVATLILPAAGDPAEGRRLPVYAGLLVVFLTGIAATIGGSGLLARRSWARALLVRTVLGFGAAAGIALTIVAGQAVLAGRALMVPLGLIPAAPGYLAWRMLVVFLDGDAARRFASR